LSIHLVGVVGLVVAFLVGAVRPISVGALSMVMPAPMPFVVDQVKRPN
jgi:hypothetical protein